MKCQKLFPEKNKKKKISMSYAENFTQRLVLSSLLTDCMCQKL